MIFASSNVLGIAVTDRAIAIAELSGKGTDRMVRRAGTLALPAELSFDDPKTLGQVLHRFLKEKGFSASHAVVGLPAKWLAAVEKEVPPAGNEQIKAMLRLQAERLPMAESGDVVFDYAGINPSGKPGKVLLVAVLRKQMEKVRAAMEEAGVTIVAMTATGLAVASAAEAGSKAAQGKPVVLLGRYGAEVVLQQQGTPRLLKYFSVSSAGAQGGLAVGPLGMEVRRAIALGSGLGGGEVLLFDSAGLDESQVNELSEKSGMKIRGGDNLSLMGVKSLVRSTPGSGDDGAVYRYAPAVALATVGGNRSLLPLDFIKSRLAPPPVRRYGRKTVWSVALGVLFVLGIGYLWFEVYNEQTKLADIKAERTRQNTLYVEAKRVKDQVDFSNLYFKERTPVMECLKHLTLAFHDNDPIWAANLTLKEERDGRDLDRVDGTFDGKTTDNNVPLIIEGRLRENPRFSNVSVRAISSMGTNARQREQLYSYSIGFAFNPNPGPATQPTQPIVSTR